MQVKKASYDTSLEKVGGPVAEFADALIFYDADKEVTEILVSNKGQKESINLLRGFASLLILVGSTRLFFHIMLFSNVFS